eukprot:364743-Chlamydomonas_euryale.AAC.82
MHNIDLASPTTALLHARLRQASSLHQRLAFRGGVRTKGCLRHVDTTTLGMRMTLLYCQVQEGRGRQLGGWQA